MPEETCLITGGSRGIGLATAREFVQRGCRVVLAARSAEQLAQAGEELRRSGAACETVAADVGSTDGAQRAVDAALEHFGRIDVLVNNAGYAPLHPVAQMDDAVFTKAMAINCAAVFYMTRAAWPALQAQGDGVIINVSSVSSVDPFPGFAVYGASKAWVNVFTKAVAGEGKPVGIRVFCVAPGAVETGMLRGLFPDLPAEQVLDPADVARTIVGICDERFRHSVGETIFVKR